VNCPITSPVIGTIINAKEDAMTLRTIIALISLFTLFWLSLATRPVIHVWERDAGYPYGKMCNSIFTGYVDTCRR
jgi:hypothetical protein